MSVLKAHVVCFFRNHDADLLWRHNAIVGFHCNRCGSEGEKMWMTGAWFVNWLLHDRRFN